MVRCDECCCIIIHIFQYQTDKFIVDFVNSVNIVSQSFVFWVSARNSLVDIPVVAQVDAVQMDVEQLPVWVGFKQVTSSIHMPVIYFIKGFQRNVVAHFGVTVEGTEVAHWTYVFQHFFVQRFWIVVFIIIQIHYVTEVYTSFGAIFIDVYTAHIVCYINWFIINVEGIINWFGPAC